MSGPYYSRRGSSPPSPSTFYASPPPPPPWMDVTPPRSPDRAPHSLSSPHSQQPPSPIGSDNQPCPNEEANQPYPNRANNKPCPNGVANQPLASRANDQPYPNAAINQPHPNTPTNQPYPNGQNNQPYQNAAINQPYQNGATNQSYPYGANNQPYPYGATNHPYQNIGYYAPHTYYPSPPPPPPRKSHHRRKHGRKPKLCWNPCCCCGCCGCLMNCLLTCMCQIICIILVVAAIIIFICWLIFRPNAVKFYATGASLTQFDLKGNNLQYNLALNLTIRNPNKRIGIYYDTIEANAFYEGEIFATKELEPFFQHHKSTNSLSAEFNGQNVVVLQDKQLAEYNDDKGSGMYAIDVKINLRLRMKFLIFKMARLKPSINCDLRVPLSGVASQAFESKSCNYVLYWEGGNKVLVPNEVT